MSYVNFTVTTNESGRLIKMIIVVSDEEQKWMNVKFSLDRRHNGVSLFFFYNTPGGL